MKDKIKKLENNQKPKINPKKGVIYILETADGYGHYKVGKTINLKKRMNNYNANNKDDIIPIYILETESIDDVEKCVKQYAKKYQYRKYKEIYKIDLNMLKELLSDCEDFREKVNLKMRNRSVHQTAGNHYLAIFKDN
jgi:hypothetical protein